MPDITDKQWDEIIAFVGENVLPVLLIVVVAVIALRLASMFVHGIVKALLDREATEGTAQELSAVELKKRMDTLESLLGNAIRFFIIVIAGADGPGPARARHRAGGRRARRRRHRRRLRGAEHWSATTSTAPHPRREPVREGRRRAHRRRRGHGRGLQAAAHDAARPRRRRPHRPQRRDQGGLQPDPGVGAHQPGRDRRLRHRHRQGDRRRRRGRPRDGRATRSGSAGSSRRRGSSGSRRSGEYGVTLKILGTVRAPDQWAAAGELRKRLLAAFAANGIEIPRPQRVVLSRDPDGPRRAAARPAPVRPTTTLSAPSD